MTEYVELHGKSAFSFLESAAIPEDLATTCDVLQMKGMALVDTDNISGAPRFYIAAKKLGIKAHIGAEITSTGGFRYTLLVENRQGYQNLCRLITDMKMRSPKGEHAATDADLERYKSGLVCFTGGQEGPLARALSQGTARECIDKLTGIFGHHNVYAELQRHHHRDEEARNQAIVELARRAKLPLIATNGVQYARPAQRELFDALTCVKQKTTIDSAGRMLSQNAERYLKPASAMSALFSDLPEAIANTAELHARLDFTLKDLGYEFPIYPVPSGETIDSYLRRQTDIGARDRYRPYYEKARKQIEHELAVIEKLKLGGYFLIVWDIIQFCRRSNILVQGRGSAANSAVCYALGITAVDPVAMELLFERFLTEERGEWPDIDMDLPSGDQRERVIQYVYERYGKRGAAMTANVISYRGRSAARDIGKALGLPQPDLERLSGLVPHWGFRDPSETTERRFRDAGFNLHDPLIQKFFHLYRETHDLPRHLGQHSGGMVICQGALDCIVPLEPATMPGRVVVQWDKEDCADLGLIKVDLLGLGMMAVLEETIYIIRDVYHEDVSLAHLPAGDPDVYSALQKADTIGLFQVESRAQMSCLPRLMPKKFYDIVVQVAIIRPGPIVGKMLHPYLKRRQGLEPATCLHPCLESVLQRTLGVPLFQEQLLRMAMIACGFTGGEAEDLRRAMGFKRSEERMRDLETKLRRGMENKGITGETQDRIVLSITAFALYGFPESHAASFALLAYASAYLKTHYLAAFTAAILNNQPMGFYHPSTLVKDAQRHGLHFFPVDVQQSEWLCTAIDRDHVRLGFNYAAGVRKQVAKILVEQRKRYPFASIQDLTRRVPELRKDELRRLAQIGALNSIENTAHRRDALWQSELALRSAGPLFDQLPPETAESPLAIMTARERVDADLRGTRLTIGIHPVGLRRDELNALGVIRASDVKHIPEGRQIRVAGSVICRQRPGTAKGFAFLSLEDETGIVNAIVTPDLFDTHRTTIIQSAYLMVEGILQNQQNAVSIKAKWVESLSFRCEPFPSHDFR